MAKAFDGLTEPVYKELDIVTTQSTFGLDGLIFPSGSVGTIVHVYPGSRAFEVEFSEPSPAVVTLEAEDLREVQWRR